VAFTFINSVGTATTSSAIDTRGAVLIAISVSYPIGGSFVFNAPTDNPGASPANTWIPGTPKVNGSSAVVIYYCINPTTDASHTFSNNCTEFAVVGFFSTIEVQVFGTATGISIDKQNGGTTTFGTTVQPGTVTPSATNELIVTGIGQNGGGGGAGNPFSIDSSFAVSPGTAPANGSGGIPGAMAYKIKTDALAENPTWTSSFNNPGPNVAVIMTFQAGAATPDSFPSYRSRPVSYETVEEEYVY